MKKIFGLKQEGSYTIEISLIMPIVLGVIFLILYFAIYTHDKSVIDRAVIKVVAGSYDEEEYSNLAIEAENTISDAIENGLIAKWDILVEHAFLDDQIQISIIASMKHTQGLIDSIVTDRLFTVREEIMVPIGNEYRNIRDQYDL